MRTKRPTLGHVTLLNQVISNFLKYNYFHGNYELIFVRTSAVKRSRPVKIALSTLFGAISRLLNCLADAPTKQNTPRIPQILQFTLQTIKNALPIITGLLGPLIAMNHHQVYTY